MQRCFSYYSWSFPYPLILFQTVTLQFINSSPFQVKSNGQGLFKIGIKSPGDTFVGKQTNKQTHSPDLQYPARSTSSLLASKASIALNCSGLQKTVGYTTPSWVISISSGVICFPSFMPFSRISINFILTCAISVFFWGGGGYVWWICSNNPIGLLKTIKMNVYVVFSCQRKAVIKNLYL